MHRTPLNNSWILWVQRSRALGPFSDPVSAKAFLAPSKNRTGGASTWGTVGLEAAAAAPPPRVSSFQEWSWSINSTGFGKQVAALTPFNSGKQLVGFYIFFLNKCLNRVLLFQMLNSLNLCLQDKMCLSSEFQKMSFFLVEYFLGLFFSRKKQLLWEKCWYREGEGGRQYFLKLQILTSFLTKICFSELLNRVHLSSIASQEIDRGMVLFLRKKKTSLHHSRGNC